MTKNAVEAALQIKDTQGASITVISSGTSFALDVMKKPLSMGADELVLLQDDAFRNSVDSFFTVQLLTAAIKKLGGFDLIICGRQASDWDNAQVPLGVAENPRYSLHHPGQEGGRAGQQGSCGASRSRRLRGR